MTTTSFQSLLAILLDALRHPDQRTKLIREFQQTIWNTSQNLGASWAWEVLRDLAYDLDFYEPDKNVRSEDPSFFGDARAEQEIRLALKKLKDGGIPFSLMEDQP